MSDFNWGKGAMVAVFVVKKDKRIRVEGSAGRTCVKHDVVLHFTRKRATFMFSLEAEPSAPGLVCWASPRCFCIRQSFG